MNRIIKFPTAMVTGDYTASSLVLDGGSVIDQCIATAGDKGTFFLEQHLLYVVLGGEVRLNNTTPAKWIREKRLSKARQMLQSSQMSVADVAYSLGFENPTHFSRIFKQQYGISPSTL